MKKQIKNILSILILLVPVMLSCKKAPEEKRVDTIKTFTDRFADPPAEYRAIPFWVWNEKISAEGIDFQLEEFKKAGVGGVFVHPRPGLMTEYLSEEWHSLFDHAVRKGKELGMQVWIYDENSYPSGFAGGHVPAQMPDSYKHGAGLAMEKQEVLKVVLSDTVAVVLKKEGDQFKEVTKEAEKENGQAGNWYIFRKTYPDKSWWYGGYSYVDLLYPGVTEKFLEITMKGYEERNRADFGNTLAGIFTDEPNLEAALSDGALIRWTPDLWDAFLKKWGYDLRVCLPSIVEETGNWRKVRHDYYELLLDLFIERWSKPWYEYCEANNLKWTGHYWEHGWPVPTDGIDELAFYTWHQMPGVDMLGFRLDSAGLGGQFGNDRAIRELRSAANQSGAKRTLSETYGGGGWDMTFSEQKRLADWQFALGVNSVNLCLSFYSLNGVRKFDYPLSFTYHEPWWAQYKWMGDYLGRISMAMASGEQINHTLILQPNTTAWMYFSRKVSNPRIGEIGNGFKKFIYLLEQQQIEYDLGSENVLKRMGSVKGKSLTVGKRDYSLVVIPAEMENIDRSTLTLLEKYIENGGKVLAFRENIPLVDGESSSAPDKLKAQAGDNWVTGTSPDEPVALKLLMNQDFVLNDISRNGMLYHQRRIMDDGQLLFIANPHKTKSAEASVTMQGKNVSCFDLITGKMYTYPFDKVKGGVSFKVSLEPAGSFLFAITDQKLNGPEYLPIGGAATEIVSAGPLSVKRESDNVLVMDYLDLKAAASEKKDIYFMDAAIGLYKELGIDMGNPWQHKIQYRKNYLELDTLLEGKPGFEVAYHFNISENLNPDAARQIRAVAERPELWSLSVNGNEVPAAPGKYWVDKNFAVYAIGPYLKSGDNILRLKAPRMHVLAEIMPVYLLGDFLVKPSEKGFRIFPGDISSTGSWKEAGLPFYPGKVAYSMTFDVQKDAGAVYQVKLGEWKGTVAEVKVNGMFAGIIAWKPDELDVTEYLKAGKNEISVTLTGSLKNTFGPFHDNGDDWIIGPHSWIKAPGKQPPGSGYYLNDYGLMEPFRLVCRVRDLAAAQESDNQKLDCFSILVGKNASADGSVIAAHTEDTGTELVNYYKVPARDHQPGEEILFNTGGKTTQAGHTLGYLWINLPVCDCCDTYINEPGVFIGSNGCPSREDQPELEDGGIVYKLRRIVAERAHNAREGVKLAGQLIDEFGYASSGRTYIIADTREGWIMNVVNGKHWVAVRVPDDEIAVIPNSFTIREVNLADTVNFLGSPDIIDYAIGRGWYNPQTDGAFAFTKAYSNPGSLTHPDNIHRMWRGMELLSGRKYDVNGILPFSFKPEKKAVTGDVMKVLRDHYEGTELDKSQHYTKGNPHRVNSGTICSGGSQYSVVAHLRSWLPVEIGTVAWIAPFRPCTQAYTAWYPAMTSLPAIYAKGDYEMALKNHFDPAFRSSDGKPHAFRTFVSLVDSVDKDYGRFIKPVQEVWQTFEKINFRAQDRFEEKVVGIYQKDPRKAIQVLTDYTSRKAVEIYSIADKLSKKINK
jgi:dipeptidase